MLGEQESAEIAPGADVIGQPVTFDHLNNNVTFGLHNFCQLFLVVKMCSGPGELNAPGFLKCAVNILARNQRLDPVHRTGCLRENPICC